MRLVLIRWMLSAAFLLVWLPFAAAVPIAQAHGGAHIAVTTRSYDNSRVGANLNETILNTANVRPGTFGKIYSRNVDGQIYAQPLYLPDVAMPEDTHNVVFVATQKNNVYAFDADDPAAATPLWQVNLGQYGESVVCDPGCSSDFGSRYNGQYRDIQPNVGITGTPVIDQNTGTLYVVTFERLGAARPFSYRHRLHALDITNGNEKFGGPQVIQASYQGTANDNVGGVITFQSVKQLQRSALLLLNGVVYVAFAGYADTDPYHGWVLGYDAATLQQRYVFNTTPDNDPSNGSQPDANDGEGGIWMSGQGLSADANGNIYGVVGNGNYVPGGRNFGNSVLRLRPAASGTNLTVESFFTPNNYSFLNAVDYDLGVTGAMLIPGTNKLIAGSKEGKIYLLDRTDLGGVNTTTNDDSNALQTFLATKQWGNHIHGSPVYWNSPSGGRMFLWSEQDRLRAFSFDSNLFTINPVMTGSYELPYGMPGGILSLSANGSAAGTGIIWASTPIGNANNATRVGELRAYDAAANGQQEAIWNSATNSSDQVGNFAKFNPPMVADGKVFVGSFGMPNDPNGFTQDKLVVYGLLAPAIVDPPAALTVAYGTAATLTVRASGAGPLAYQWFQGETGDTSTPIATTATLTTPPMTNPTRFWVQVRNSAGSVQSASALIGVQAIETQVTLANSASATVYGQPLTLTATVNKVQPNQTALTGTVIFRDVGVVLGSAAIDGNGVASLTTSELTVGNHIVQAGYSGPTAFTQANSADQVLAVRKASTTAAVTVTPTSVVPGQAMTLTAQIAAVAPSTRIPSGSVQFLSGSTLVGTAMLDQSGQAQLVATSLPVGSPNVVAVYQGNGSFLASQSIAQTIQVNKVKTATALIVAPTQPLVGQSMTLLVQVALVAPAIGTPTGSVQFLSGGTVLGTVSLDAGGQAQLVLPVGSADLSTVSAVFLGDANQQSSQGSVQVTARYGVWLPLTER